MPWKCRQSSDAIIVYYSKLTLGSKCRLNGVRSCVAAEALKETEMALFFLDIKVVVEVELSGEKLLKSRS